MNHSAKQKLHEAEVEAQLDFVVDNPGVTSEEICEEFDRNSWFEREVKDLSMDRDGAALVQTANKGWHQEPTTRTFYYVLHRRISDVITTLQNTLREIETEETRTGYSWQSLSIMIRATIPTLGIIEDALLLRRGQKIPMGFRLPLSARTLGLIAPISPITTHSPEEPVGETTGN